MKLRLGKCTKMSGNILLSDAAGLPCAIPPNGDSMKSSILYAGAALACALGLSACGGGDGDLPLSVTINGGTGVSKAGLVLVNKSNGDEIAVPANTGGVTFGKYLSTDDEFNIDVKTLPSNVSACTFTNNKARANYYTIYTLPPTVSCTVKPHDLGIKVTNLTGSGLVLVNGADRQTVTANGGAEVTVQMAKVPEDGPYGVTILTQPDTQTCAISNGSGIMSATGPSTMPVVACGPKTP
jgi:hypothetical protein